MRSNLVLTYFSKDAQVNLIAILSVAIETRLQGYLGNRETLRDVIECYFTYPKVTEATLF